MQTLLLLALCALYCNGSVLQINKTNHSNKATLNQRPIVGVLSQEQEVYHDRGGSGKNASYIASSYVKSMEASGARVVPIMIGKDRSYYEYLLKKLNGVLLPGGGVYFNKSNGYADAAQHIIEIAKELNDGEDYFPVFGTCLGFEYILVLDSSGRDVNENRISCFSYNNLPLEFTDDYRQSKMFANIPDDLSLILANENSTINAHMKCIGEANMKAYNMFKNWRVMSYSHDKNGIKFVSTVEHKRYPIYGTQFHPEKPAFEWKASRYYTHSSTAIMANRYFSDFFVNECRKNNHTFLDEAEENKYLIYNYCPVFTGAHGSLFEQWYMFRQ